MRTVISIALLTFAALANAQIYKWVDANGKVQFSDQPPPKVNAQTIKVTPSAGMGQQAAPVAQESLKDKEAALKKRQEEQRDAEAKAEEKDRQARELATYCSEMKGQLQGMQRANRVQRYDENGKATTLSRSDRDAERAKLEAEIAKRCSN